MGRLPKPAILKSLAGNPAKKPIPEEIPMPSGELVAPDYFDDERREIWEFVLQNIPPGLIAPVDGAILESWTNAFALYRDASRRLLKASSLIKVRDHISINPLLKIQRMQFEIMAHCAKELGFTPVARARLARAVFDQEAGKDTDGILD